jgi:hypothetical protein
MMVHATLIRAKIIIAIIWFVSGVSLTTAATIDLSGRWELQLDPEDQGAGSTCWEKPFNDSITLPGTTSQARKGNPLELQPELPPVASENWVPKRGLTYGRDNAALKNSPLAHLYQRYSYVGPAWYRRRVEIPASWTDREVELVLERVIWESRVWINGQLIGDCNSLTTPHRYRIGAALKPGPNDIVIRVDNRRQLAIGDPHAYTDQAQTIWNGIVGQIALVATDPVGIYHLDLRPDLERKGVQVTVRTRNGSGHEQTTALFLQAKPENFKGKALPILKVPFAITPGDGSQTVFYPMGTNFELWSEFNPCLYEMRASLDGNPRAETVSVFGMRKFTADHHHFFINGRETFLRGTVNCCEFPKTGFPDMTGTEWEKIFSTVRDYGLNHVRFHTWCPPEIAFSLADRYGIYLEVELPNWCFNLGKDARVTQFFRDEGERMIREYGNHPSWVMFTMGNELKGDYGVLDALEMHFRELDPGLLYDSTTYPSARGPNPGPEDNYYISQDTQRGRARGQDIFNNTPPSTTANFDHAVSCISVPFISHEVGQYCVYPNLAEIPKYNGALRSLGFEAIRADLKKKGRLDEAPIYTRDSGKLAALLYKEEIERALRTSNQAGFQLLQLNDFPGQGTSTVGLLDAFWDSKKLITPALFRKFCGPVVPLALMPKRVYQNNESFEADVEIANFGSGPITGATVAWKIQDDGKEIGSGTFPKARIELGQGIRLGHIQQSLAAITRASKLTLSVGLTGTSIANDWDIWVYPASEEAVETNSVAILQTADASFYQALRDGKRVLLLPSRAGVKNPIAAQFVPVFWNPVMFPNQPSSMGAMIDANAQVFADFPTDPWTNWQWWELLHNSYAVNLEGAANIAAPFRFVDKFNRNALPAAIFEARVGPGRLLVCTLDVSSDLNQRIVARQLRRALVKYVSGPHFSPHGQLDPDTLSSYFLSN